MQMLYFEPYNEESKGLLTLFKVLYYKEEVDDVANEISLFPCESIEIAPWNYNAMTHTSGSKDEVGDR